MRNKKTYTKAQQSAILHGKGPAAIFAGPGSGKTFVLTEHIYYLIYTLCINPNNILVITFTKAAAEQMKERFYEKSKTYLPIVFKTFHAFFYQIISQSLSYKNKKIISSKEKQNICKIIAFELFPAIKKNTDLFEQISLCIVKRKNYQEENVSNSYFTQEENRKIIQIYEEEKEKIGRLDFVDLVYLCHGLLKHDQILLEKIRMQFPYILIDEFQDITPIQYDIIKLIAFKSKNIFIVGDEDQSIYRFCGSKSDCMQKFILDFPKAKVYFLDINFRSCQEIIKKSQLLINHNRERINQTIHSNSLEKGKFEIVGFQSKTEQYQFVVDKISEWINEDEIKKKSISRIAVISRTNENNNLIQLKFIEKNIYVKSKKKIENIFESPRIIDIISYLRFAKKGYLRKDLLMVLNKPNRYIRNNAFRTEKVDFKEVLQYYEMNESMKQCINQLSTQMSLIEKMSIAGAIHFIRVGIGYDLYLQELAVNKNENYNQWLMELDILETAAKKYVNFDDFIRYIKFLTTEIMNSKKEEKLSYDKVTKVELITMHAAKGLEFDCVFIVDTNEGSIPHRKAISKEDIEEERRLFYVALTRAKKEVYILYVDTTKKNRHLKSRYIKECINER